LSYVTEEDTIESLTERFGYITGEKDYAALRLAVVVDRVPHFIPRASTAASETVGGAMDAAAYENEDSTSTRGSNVSPKSRNVWDFVVEKCHTFDLTFDVEWARKTFRKKLDPRIPLFGIQRPSSDVSGNSRRTSSSIKING
jgi:hypothetical protein